MTSFQNPITRILLFLSLVTVCYFGGYWLIFRTGSATPLMLSVGLAAVLTCLISHKSLASLGWVWASPKYSWASYFLPLAYAAIAYFFIWMVGFGQWFNLEFLIDQRNGYNLADWSDFSIIVFHFLFTATFSFLLLLPGVLGEEIAWRGLLVPELAKIFSFRSVALISGFIWAAWHWPLMLKGLYGNDITPIWFQLFFFSLGIMSMSVIMTYFRLKTQSLWPAVILHMSHNVFLQKFFTEFIYSRYSRTLWVGKLQIYFLKNSKLILYVTEYGNDAIYY